MRVAIDMDEVIADAFYYQIEWLVDRYEYRFDATSFRGQRINDLVDPEHYNALLLHLHEGVAFGKMKPIAGAQDALAVISGKVETFVTTAAMEFPNSLPFKFQWLQTFFPFLDPLNFVPAYPLDACLSSYASGRHVHQPFHSMG